MRSGLRPQDGAEIGFRVRRIELHRLREKEFGDGAAQDSRRLMSRFFKIALLVVVAFCALCYFYAPARLAAIVALGRSPVCPMSRAIHCADELQKQIEYKDSILQASKRLENDPARYHLWDTPDGR